MTEQQPWIRQLILRPTPTAVSQKEFDSALVSMILTDMMPVATVDHKGFVAFCERYSTVCSDESYNTGTPHCTLKKNKS